MNPPGRHIQILRPGMLTTVQDLGRTGYQQYGMPVSGPMDEWSFRLANLLVGNPPGAACLEITIAGPSILLQAEGWIAICGADIQPRLNGETLENHRAYRVKTGDTLSTGFAAMGCRSYIAFSGGIDVPMVMGSRATYLTGKTGGYEGRALKEGDVIPLGEEEKKPFSGTLPPEVKNIPFAPGPVRLLPGPETDSLDLEALKNLLNSTFTISPNSNRMGYRLEGAAVKPKPEKSNIVSAPVTMGTIQAPAGGQPLILMADRQTTGGYPRIALVATIDLPRVGQLKPGDTITFEEIGLEIAQRLLKERMRLLGKLH
ncbi:MAG: biotin-dependent carboxyltransferase family protein [Bacteroidota bacterium]